MTIMCDKFHWNPVTKYGAIASREIGVNGRTDVRACVDLHVRTDGRTANQKTE